MKTSMKGMIAVLFLLCGGLAFAQQPDIGGSWAGKLEIAPGSSITVQFTLSKDAGGGWKAVLNSPDSGAIKDMAADSATFDGSMLDIKVAALSGGYKGTWKNGGFEGTWSQPGNDIPMNLAPYVAPTLSEAGKKLLMGQWHGKLKTQGLEFNIVFHFENNDKGEFAPGVQNADVGNNQTPMENLSLENDDLLFQLGGGQAEYRGKLAGNNITGHLKQAGQEIELNLVKGEFKAEVPKLALTDADFEKLGGKWSGPMGPLTIVFRIEKNADGVIVAFLDVPAQKAQGLKVTAASLTDNHLELSLSIPPVTYSGDLDGNTITGNWKQGPANNPLTLTKEE